MFYRAIRLCSSVVVIGVSYLPKDHALHIEVNQHLTKEEQQELLTCIKHMWSTEVDLTPFYNQFTDGPLQPIIQKRKGLHLVLDSSIYECLIKTIIGQQLNISFAATLEQRLVQLAGEEINYKGMCLPVFPDPEKVASLCYEDLQKLQFNRRKAEYIIDISRLIVEGKLDLEGLMGCSEEEVMEKLLPLRGIGRWTVECVLLFGMGKPDLLPAADIGLRNAIAHVFELDQKPSEEEVRKLGEQWKPYRSYVTFYLWDAITEQKIKKKQI